MRSARIVGLFAIMGLLMGVLCWRWVSQRGLITLDSRNAPLAKLIQSIERQGKVEVHTNADLVMPVTLRLKRAPVYEAIETLAARIDAEARLAYIVAPPRGEIEEVLTTLGSGAHPSGWTVFSPGFGGRLVLGETAGLDPRQVEWKVSSNTDKSLQGLLDQGAQKTGAIFAVPVEWNPTPVTVPLAGKVGKVTAELLRNAGGRAREVFLLTVDTGRENRPVPGERSEQRRRTVFSERRGERRENPEWTAERVEARIALLPKDEQAAARKRFDDARAFWESIRGLPDEERLTKIEEYMSQPEVQLRMEERAALREGRQTPEQREQRYRNYIQRKEQIKGPPSRS